MNISKVLKTVKLFATNKFNITLENMQTAHRKAPSRPVDLNSGPSCCERALVLDNKNHHQLMYLDLQGLLRINSSLPKQTPHRSRCTRSFTFWLQQTLLIQAETKHVGLLASPQTGPAGVLPVETNTCCHTEMYTSIQLHNL